MPEPTDPKTPAEIDALPDDELAGAVTDRLFALGLVDVALFDSLVAAKPERADEIRRVQAICLDDSGAQR